MVLGGDCKGLRLEVRGQDSKIRDHGSGFREEFEDSAFFVLGLSVWNSGFRVYGLGLRIASHVFTFKGSWFWVYGTENKILSTSRWSDLLAWHAFIKEDHGLLLLTRISLKKGQDRFMHEQGLKMRGGRRP